MTYQNTSILLRHNLAHYWHLNEVKVQVGKKRHPRGSVATDRIQQIFVIGGLKVMLLYRLVPREVLRP